MENLSIDIDLPSGTRVFVFGSYVLSPTDARDLDLLVVYDAHVVAPENAYEAFRPLLTMVRQRTGLPVDVTLLSRTEEAGINFIGSESCVELTPRA